MTWYPLVACRRCRCKHPAMTPRCLGTWSQVMAEEHIKRIKRKWDVHQREKIMRSFRSKDSPWTLEPGWEPDKCFFSKTGGMIFVEWLNGWMVDVWIFVEWLILEFLKVMKQIQRSLFFRRSACSSRYQWPFNLWPVQGSTWQLLKISATPKEWYPSHAESYAPWIFLHISFLYRVISIISSPIQNKRHILGWLKSPSTWRSVRRHFHDRHQLPLWKLVSVWIFSTANQLRTIWDSMDGYNFHFGPPGAGAGRPHMKKSFESCARNWPSGKLTWRRGKCRFLLGWKVTRSSKKDGIRYPK